MEDEIVSDALAACRLLFGQAVMEIVAEKKPVTQAAISEKIVYMFARVGPAQPEPVMALALRLLARHSD